MCVSGECNEESQNWSLTKVKNANETTTEKPDQTRHKSEKRVFFVVVGRVEFSTLSNGRIYWIWFGKIHLGASAKCTIK